MKLSYAVSRHFLARVVTRFSLLLVVLGSQGCNVNSSNSTTTNSGGIATVNSVSGTLSNGSVLVIKGSNFGLKSVAKPQYWADFASDSAPSSLGVNTSWSYLSPTATRVSETVGTRTGAFLRDDVSLGEAARGVAIFGFDMTDKVYIAFKRYYAYDITANQGPIGFNNKSLRLWPDQSGGAIPYGNDIFWGWQGSEGLDSFRATNENTMTNGTHGTLRTINSRATWKFGEWLNEQVVYKSSSIGVEDGLFSWYRNGDNIMYNWKDDSTGEIFPDERHWQLRDADRPNYHTKIYFDQVSNGTGPGPLYVYYSNIYVDNTWERVMLSTSATWSAALDAEVQIPSAWSDHSITVTVNLGDLDTSQPLYLYVVNKDGSANADGYPLP